VTISNLNCKLSIVRSRHKVAASVSNGSTRFDARLFEAGQLLSGIVDQNAITVMKIEKVSRHQGQSVVRGHVANKNATQR
jgi:primosomal protein N''